jgi:hypothetical protein
MQFELADKLRARTVTIPTGTLNLTQLALIMLLQHVPAAVALLSQCDVQSKHQA